MTAEETSGETSGEFDEIRVEPLDDKESKARAARRMRDAQSWVDVQVQQAIARGEFDDLPGRGKPIEGLGGEHDPDWWVKKLVERERLVVLPPSVQLRKDDAALEDLIDQQHTEQAAREIVEDFNARVLAARYGLPAGPPLITMPRDVELTLAAWRERREQRLAQARQRAEAAAPQSPRKRRSRWPWRRHRGST